MPRTIPANRGRRRALVAVLVLVCAEGAPGAPQDAEIRPQLEQALRTFFAAERADGKEIREVLALAKGREDLLAEIVKTKSFVAERGAVARRGFIDAKYRFRDLGEPKAGEQNAALLHGPETKSGLVPLVVFVPDGTTTSGLDPGLGQEARTAGRFIFLVPDEKQDNRWNPTQHERRRHVGPLRDFLLTYAIDPDRLFLFGTGRGGHATWDVGLIYAGLWAAIHPCNGGPIHEGGYKKSGGVFLENAKSLVFRTVYNTTFDHGIEGCRFAKKKFQEWGYRFEAVEEAEFRHMDIPEAMAKVGATVRDAHPREIVKRFNHVDAGEHYWLRGVTRHPHEWSPTARIPILGKWPDEPAKQRELIWETVKKECAFLKASVKDNAFDVTATGIGVLRVWFDPEIVDYAKKVTLTINGRSRDPFPIEKRSEVMLKHVHETGDTSRLYWAFRDVAVNG
jgi:hypothetical protein